MVAEQQRYCITFNGCVYNYLELRDELRGRGFTFRTESDTEVVLAAYMAWGPACLDRLNGMFAFAIWDEDKDQLFCARDRLGIKPFYFVTSDQGFMFASEPKALLASGHIRREAYVPAVQDYLIFQSPLSDATMFSGIQRLAPGTFLCVDGAGHNIEKRQYWNLTHQPTSESDGDAEVEALAWLLNDAVRLRTRSDVPIGTHLSGGLDSSFIAGSAAGQSEAVRSAFVGAFDETGFDESSYARVVAAEANLKLLETRPSVDQFPDALEKIAWFMDEPSAGPGVFPQYMLSELASRHVKVTLGGQGGDEVFGGYMRYLACYLEECLIGAIREPNGHYPEQLSSLSKNLSALKSYEPLLKHYWNEGIFDPPADRYFHMLDRSGDMAFIDTSDWHDTRNRFDDVFDASDASGFLDRILDFDLRVHLQGLLQVEDRVSMAWGLESRVPLLDHRIVEFMAKVPASRKFRDGEPKSLFKRAIGSQVPPAILQRTDKMGFPVPLQKWFAGPLRDYVCDILLSTRARTRGIYDGARLETHLLEEADFGRGVWGLLNLELWFRTHIDAS